MREWPTFQSAGTGATGKPSLPCNVCSLDCLGRESRKEEESLLLGDFPLSPDAALEMCSFLKHFLERTWCFRQELLYEYKGGG